MPVRSAGVLLWRRRADVEVFLGHMGGPFWARKDQGAWSLPKGEYDEDEEPVAAAAREWREELGVDLPVPLERLHPLGETRLSSGKRLSVWAAEGELDPEVVVPGTFALEWPPRSGRLQQFPELDRVAWCDLARASDLVTPSQRVFLDRLRRLVT
jgi:predicted NUDIX family NTP pyrophosphohydrolase